MNDYIKYINNNHVILFVVILILMLILIGIVYYTKKFLNTFVYSHVPYNNFSVNHGWAGLSR